MGINVVVFVGQTTRAPPADDDPKIFRLRIGRSFLQLSASTIVYATGLLWPVVEPSNPPGETMKSAPKFDAATKSNFSLNRTKVWRKATLNGIIQDSKFGLDQ